MTPPRTQSLSLRVLNSGAGPTSGVETLEVISPELALVDPELATRARALLRTYDGDELVAAVQPTPHADRIVPEPPGDEQVLSPELVLVDPELAERARAQLAYDEPASPAAPIRQRERRPQPLRPLRVPQRVHRVEPVEATLRARSKRGALVAVVALVAGLGVAAAIWARYSGGASASRPIEQAPFQPPELSPATALSERGSDKTTATASKQGIADQAYVRRAPRPRRTRIGDSASPSGVRTQTLGRPRPPAFQVLGAPKEPLDEIPLPARARRLEAWLSRGRDQTPANQSHWLYQHAWITTGARFGWWHGAEALRILIRVDRRVEALWGIGYRSEEVARGALSAVEASAR